MKHLLIALFVVFLTTTPALAGGLHFQGDDQTVGVKNAAGDHSATLNPDGTLSLDAFTLTPLTVPAMQTDLDSVEAVLSAHAADLDSIENELDQINSVKLPSKMNLVSPVTADNVLKVDANGQAQDAGFAASNVFRRDGTQDMQGDLNMASHKMINLQAGTAANDAVTKAQLDAAISGLSWKNPVQAFNLVGNTDVTTANGMTPSLGEQYVMIDAGTLTAGSLAVVAGDIVEFNGTAWVKIVSGSGGFVPAGTRAILSKTTALVSPYTDGADENKIVAFGGPSNTGVDTAETANEVSVLVQDPGHISLYDNKAYVFEGATVAGGTWIQFAGAGQYSAGDALNLTGTTFNVKYNDTTIGVNGSNQLEVKATSIANAHIAAGAAIDESKVNLAYTTTALNSAITTHTGDATIHRSINDAATSTTGLWSSDKVHAEDEAYLAVVNAALAGKSNVGHTHTASEVTDFTGAVNAIIAGGLTSSVEGYLNGTSQVVLAGGKDKTFIGEKINIGEGSAVAFCNVDVAANAYATLRITGTLFGSLGKAVASGEWLVVVRKVAAGNVAVSAVQVLSGIDSVHEAAAELKFTDLATVLTATTVDSDTVALKINSALEGSDGITQYGIDYSIHSVGVGVAGYVAQ